MFRENRLQEPGRNDNSVAGWTRTFRNAPTLSRLQMLRMRLLPEFSYIKRYLHSPILDAGCGAGQWVEFLRRQGYAVHGLDYSNRLIETNKERYPDARWSVGDIRNAPLPDAFFGGIISWGVIEHDIAGPEAALHEFYRLLKPGACCIVTVPVDTERQKTIGLMDNPENRGEFFQYYFSSEELANLVESVGFEIVHSSIVPRKSIALAAPRLYFKYHGTRLFILARLAAIFGSLQKCAGMTVCIGRKPN